ncbi:hypothetical protein CAAN1_10S04038 [[Candida] anglica]
MNPAKRSAPDGDETSGPNGTFNNENSVQEFESKWRQVRACARCHRLKMRCSYIDPTHKSCKRCFAIGVECSPDEDPTARYAKKKRTSAAASSTTATDLKSVTPSEMNEKELLAKLDSLTSSLQETLRVFERVQQGKSVQSSAPLQSLQTLRQNLTIASQKVNDIIQKSNSDISTNYNSSLHHSNAGYAGYYQGEPRYPFIPYTQNIAKELVSTHKLLDLSEAKVRFEFFINEMLPYYPIVSFSKKSSNFEYLFETGPLLLLACITVTTIHDNGFSKSTSHNKSLQDLLNYYLERFISHRVYIQSDGFGIRLIQVCLVLSTWSPPPNKLGHFKNSVNLLMGLNISLCIGLGDPHTTYAGSISDDESDERNDLRTFISVYCNCGSLGLSLSRFKLVTWSDNHHIAVEKLSKLMDNRGDRFLVYYARSIKLGQEIYQALAIDSQGGVTNNQQHHTTPSISLISQSSTLPLSKLVFIAENYEQQLYQLLTESGFLSTDTSSKYSREAYLLSIMYYQILLAMYDKLLCVHLAEYERHNQTSERSMYPDDPMYINLTTKLITICENMLESYIQLNVKETVNYPTFVYYRPMHAIVLLIRTRLLIKSQAAIRMNPDIGNIKINVEHYYEKISAIISDNQKRFCSDISLAMKEILTKIERWIKVSEEYTTTSSPAMGINDSRKSTHRSSLLINLMDRSKHQEIEALEVPHDVEVKTENNTYSIQPPVTTSDAQHSLVPIDSQPPHSIQELFQEIDLDIMNYLNLLESNSNADGGMGGTTSLAAVGQPSVDAPTVAADSYFANFFSSASGSLPDLSFTPFPPQNDTNNNL